MYLMYGPRQLFFFQLWPRDVRRLDTPGIWSLPLPCYLSMKGDRRIASHLRGPSLPSRKVKKHVRKQITCITIMK